MGDFLRLRSIRFASPKLESEKLGVPHYKPEPGLPSGERAYVRAAMPGHILRDVVAVYRIAFIG